MIAIVDCNNFYASCERLFSPQIKTRPVVVLSNNDGCVVARSEEAKALGIKMGEAAFAIEDMLVKNNVAVFSSNYTLYGSISNRVMSMLARYSPHMEIYSIDEAFLDFSGMKDLFQIGANIKETIIQHVGIPVSVGIAPSKTLAKLANRFTKKHSRDIGVHVLDSPEKTLAALAATPVEDIWGVGAQYAALLHKHNMHTALDFSRASDDWVRKEMSVVGLRMLHELRGIPSIEMQEAPPPKKGICVSRSFGKLLTEKDDIREALASYMAICGEKLRRQKSCAKLITLFLHTNNFRTQDKQYYRSINVQLPTATNSTKELIHHAMMGLDRIFKPGFNFKKVGVLAQDLVPEDQVQQNLFSEADLERDARLMKALDSINQHFSNKQMVRFAIQGNGRKWKLRQEKLSACFTTRVHESLKAKVGHV